MDRPSWIDAKRDVDHMETLTQYFAYDFMHGFLLHKIQKSMQTSVKTDFSPAEPPANYPANPPAGDLRPTNPDIRLLPNIR